MDPKILTVGHGDQQLPDLFENLQEWNVRVLIDVRSVPYSRRHPQFGKSSLEGECLRREMSYCWLPALGGRPSDRSLLRADGSPDYDAMSATDDFAFALAEVIDAARREPTAILCSEGRPERCHRALMVAPKLVEAGCTVLHLLPDGSSLDDVAVPLRLL